MENIQTISNDSLLFNKLETPQLKNNNHIWILKKCRKTNMDIKQKTHPQHHEVT